MRIPDEVDILGQTWTVYQHADLDDSYGETDQKRRQILLDRGLLTNPDMQQEVFIHELLHAIVETACLVKVLFRNSKREEKVVGALAPLLYDTLKRNDLLAEDS